MDGKTMKQKNVCLQVIRDIFAIFTYGNKGNLVKVIGFIVLITFILSLTFGPPLKDDQQSSNTSATNQTENETDVDLDFNDNFNYSRADLDLGVCNEDDVDGLIDTEVFLYCSILLTGVITVILMLIKVNNNTKTKHWLLKKFHVVYPINLLEQQDNRFVYAVAFSVCTWTMVGILQGSLPFSWVEDGHAPVELRLLYKIFACLLYGFVIYPLLACLSSNHLVGYIVGALYSWTITVVYTIDFFPCAQNSKEFGLIQILIRSLMFLPLGFSMVFVSGTLTYRAFRTGVRCFKVSNKGSLNMRDNQEIYEFDYVRRLLKETYKNKLKSKEEKIPKWKSLLQKIYKPEPGFRYSQSVIVAVMLSGMTIYVLALDFIYEWLQIIYVADFELRSNLKSIKMDEHPKYLNFLQHIPLTKDVAIESYKLFLYIISVHETCFFLSIALAVVLSYLSMFAACVTYRKNMKNIYRGNHVDIPTFETRLPRMILLNSLKYVGYHVGYASWGFIIQAVVINIVINSIGAIVVLAIKFEIKDYLLQLLIRLWPVFLLAWVILTIQHLIIHFFFLQEVNGTQVVALNNRHFFFNFQYYMVFINMAVGLVACLMRMLISLFLGLWILPRLDMSTLNRAFERLDNGFSSYVCMLIVQHTQTNPVMVVFVNILLRCQLPTKSSDSAVFKSFDTLNTNSNYSLYTSNGVHMICNPKASKIRRNRWFLYITLHRNPGLLIHRQWFLDETRKAND